MKTKTNALPEAVQSELTSAVLSSNKTPANKQPKHSILSRLHLDRTTLTTPVGILFAAAYNMPASANGKYLAMAALGLGLAGIAKHVGKFAASIAAVPGAIAGGLVGGAVKAFHLELANSHLSKEHREDIKNAASEATKRIAITKLTTNADVQVNKLENVARVQIMKQNVEAEAQIQRLQIIYYEAVTERLKALSRETVKQVDALKIVLRARVAAAVALDDAMKQLVKHFPNISEQRMDEMCQQLVAGCQIITGGGLKGNAIRSDSKPNPRLITSYVQLDAEHRTKLKDLPAARSVKGTRQLAETTVPDSVIEYVDDEAKLRPEMANIGEDEHTNAKAATRSPSHYTAPDRIADFYRTTFK